MTVKERLIEYIKTKALSINRFEKTCGLSTGYVGNMRVSIQPDKIAKIAHNFPDLNTGWLLTGEGAMIKTENPIYSINREARGTPYYDVDFIGGFDLIQNDQTINPTYYIQFKSYDKADCWVNVTGHSMEPVINHGDIVALKKIEDWNTYILYGETYAIVTNHYRTIKKVRKSNKGEDFLRLMPINSEYDEQDVNKSIISHMYQVLGCVKKIF